MSPAKPTKPIDIYVRVSQVGGREGDSFISPKVQEERCRAQLAALGFEAGRVFTDLDESGSKDSRPEFDKVMARALDGTSGGIIVWKLSRFGRRVRNVLRQIHEIEEAGAAFLCVEPSIDTSGPYGKFTLTLFAALDELELDNLTAGLNTARSRAFERGVHIGPVPAGYGKDEDRHLVPNGHADEVRHAFEVWANGGSLTDVVEALEGVPTSRGATTWTLEAARRVLLNPVYIGQARQGDMVNPEAHEALIGRALWERAQARFSKDTRKRSKGKAEPAALAGLCTCGTCGSIMGRDFNTRERKGREYRFEFLRCRNRKCETGNTISLPKVERFVTDTVLPEYLKAIPAPLPADTAALEEALADAEAEVAAFLQNVPAATPGFAEALASKTDIVDEARLALADAARPAGDGVSWGDLQDAIDIVKGIEASAQASGAKVEDLPEEAREPYVAALAFIDRTIRTTLSEAGVTFTIRAGRGNVAERVVVNR